MGGVAKTSQQWANRGHKASRSWRVIVLHGFLTMINFHIYNSIHCYYINITYKYSLNLNFLHVNLSMNIFWGLACIPKVLLLQTEYIYLMIRPVTVSNYYHNKSSMNNKILSNYMYKYYPIWWPRQQNIICLCLSKPLIIYHFYFCWFFIHSLTSTAHGRLCHLNVDCVV